MIYVFRNSQSEIKYVQVIILMFDTALPAGAHHVP